MQHKPFSIYIREYRIKAGMTQDELAERADCSVATILAYEKERRDQIAPELILRIAEVLGVSYHDLIVIHEAA
jgi:transcriptional regulator with XRE-family HTH domain